MRALIAALILLAAAVSPAQAAKPDPKAATTPVSLYVNVDPVALPVVSDGRVVNYVFVTVRIDLAAGTQLQAIDALRGKEPFFRDALVRLGHRTPFNPPGNFLEVDEARLCAAYLTEARGIAGPGAVTGVRVMMQTPKSTRVASGG